MRRGLAWAVLVAALYVLALAYPVHRHVIGALSDFYRWYAPDADRIVAGLFPLNTFNPPGYPFLLALVHPLTGDHWTSGKWLSLLAAGGSGVLAFVLHRRLFGAGPALLAVSILLLSGVFTRYAISAMTDVPFLCACLAAVVVIAGGRPGEARTAIAGGVLSGVATLLRYNGAFLLVPGVVGALAGERTRRARVGLAALYLGSFLATVAPWWWLNAEQHGAAVPSGHHIDVARALELGRPERPFTSLADVVLHDPARFAWRYAGRVARTFAQSLGASLALLPVGPLAVLGVGLCLAWHRRRPIVLALVAALAFLLGMSLTHWETRYFFFLLAVYAGFAAFAIFEIGRAAGRWLGSPRAARVAVAALALWILLPSAGRTARVARVTLERQPVEILPAARYLERAAAPGATIMAVRAHIPYLSGHEWRELPPAGSVDELAAVLRASPPDYLVFDRWLRRLHPALRALATPAERPSWLEPVYRDDGVLVYAVRLGER
ncbi:MAG: glycosyltransferase family 39 protein [Candidatus Rokubacteria bacterium]|nr:glycosyltransferase family 39 protein [Candidatus Rokubacteria bacterium]